jgi:hypothetical protein
MNAASRAHGSLGPEKERRFPDNFWQTSVNIWRHLIFKAFHNFFCLQLFYFANCFIHCHLVFFIEKVFRKYFYITNTYIFTSIKILKNI